MAVYRNDTAFQDHHIAAREHFDALTRMCESQLEFFVDPSADTQIALAGFNPRVFKFAYGIKSESSAIHDALTSPNEIEVYTKFNILPAIWKPAIRWAPT